jgi:hypothetical protein
LQVLLAANARNGKRPSARRVSRKRSWSSSYSALPDVPDAPTWNIVLTASSDHLNRATYSPFDWRHSTTEQRQISSGVFENILKTIRTSANTGVDGNIDALHAT